MSSVPGNLQVEVRRVMRWALMVGAAAALACMLAAFIDRPIFFRAYLAAYHYVVGIGLGCFGLLMVYHLTGGAWGFLIRRILEAGTRTLPILAILFLPLALGLGDLFEWAHPDAVRASRELQHKEPYLNIPFFWIRAGLYFVIWISVATVLNIWSRRQDRAAGPGLKRSLATLSGVGLVLLGITIHFASVDWLMSLQPRFRSTIIGPLWASGHLLSAQAFTLVVLAAVLRRSPLKDYVSPDALNDLGNLLLTFVVVWTYMAYFGYMLIWIANMQNEVIWFLPRSSGAWTVIAWLLVIFQAAVPFFALLVRDVKRSAPALALIGALLLVTDLVFNYFQVLPSFGAAGATTLWINFLPPLAIGGLWLADFLWELQRFPLVAINDPSRESALHLRRSEEENEHWAEVSHA